MQKDTVEVIINEGGLTCTTTNPLDWAKGKLGFSDLSESWLKNESKRKTYYIGSCEKNCPLTWCGMQCVKPGTIHKARIKNGKAVIL